MAMLGLAKISFENWFRFIYKLFLVSMIIALGFMALAVSMGY
jgi:uncharacterized ion transporter superfamily protein YfcC